MANYEEICGHCLWLDEKNKSRWADEYYCNKKYRGGYHCKTDRGCRDFELDKSKVSENNPGCYITTMVCDVLGYGDNCELLTTLRNFRENYLKTKPEYLPLLLEYDQVGPIISENIRNFSNKIDLSIHAVQKYLYPCLIAINNEHYEDAVNIYQEMVYFLKELFNIPNYTIEVPENINLETLGKGRVRTYNKSAS